MVTIQTIYPDQEERQKYTDQLIAFDPSTGTVVYHAKTVKSMNNWFFKQGYTPDRPMRETFNDPVVEFVSDKTALTCFCN